MQAQIALLLVIESQVNNEVATHSNKTKIRANQSLVQNSINSRIISLFFELYNCLHKKCFAFYSFQQQINPFQINQNL